MKDEEKEVPVEEVAKEVAPTTETVEEVEED